MQQKKQRANLTVAKKLMSAKRKTKEDRSAALRLIEDEEIIEFIAALGDSPVQLTDAKCKKIKEAFPIPKEQHLIWADAEFDLRPSGIALTEKGVFIRTNVSLMNGKMGLRRNEALDDEAQKTSTQHRTQGRGGKVALFFYRWGSFEPGWFAGQSERENKALLVDAQCSKRFVEVCRAYSAKHGRSVERISISKDEGIHAANAGVIAGAAVESSQSAVFVEQRAYVNTRAGHGEMAEEANNMWDRLLGKDAEILGRDCAKNGPDRSVDGVYIQTKYYNSARGSLEACFDAETGMYRYMQDGKPMQLEVPKDQYSKVLKGFEEKIRNGKVPGVTDPNQAQDFVRRGKLDYQQAVRLTKPGTIDSLVYDAATGAVICSSAFGLTFVVTVFLAWRKTRDMTSAIQTGMLAGVQVFGISFVQHMLVAQIARTGLAKSLLLPSQYIVGKLGYQTSAGIVNGIRMLSGKGAIYGAAASGHLAKILRSNVLTSVLSYMVFSVPETYRMVSQKISGAQYVKNMSILAGSIVGGAGGAVVTGMAAAKAGGAAGTVLSPGVGTVVGIAGGFVGGTVGAVIVKAAGDVLHEDDAEALERLFQAYVSLMVEEYMLDDSEVDALVSRLNQITGKAFKRFFENVKSADNQECFIRDFLEPHLNAIVAERKVFKFPSAECMDKAIQAWLENGIT